MMLAMLGAMCFLANIANPKTENSSSAVFSDIYARGEWGKDANGKGTSGSGSSPENAKIYVEFLRDFLQKNHIQSVVDLGCGDWQFSRLINWDGIQYIGLDVVQEVIEKNTKEFSSSNISFRKSEDARSDLPQADLLICKDVLQHLTYKDISTITAQFNKYRYCLITNDVDPLTLTCENKDIPRGHYRVLDLTKTPFKLKGSKVLTYRSGLEMKQVLLIENK